MVSEWLVADEQLASDEQLVADVHGIAFRRTKKKAREGRWVMRRRGTNG